MLKHLKKIALVIIALPLLLTGILFLYEIFGMCVNHLATKNQTKRLTAVLEAEVPDVDVSPICR